MTRKTSNTFFVITSLLIIYHTTAAGGCKKDDAPSPPTPDTGTVTDVEGTVYKTIKIGNQVWMAENLKTTKYRNGENIPFVSGKDPWASRAVPKLPAYCNSGDDPGTVAVYGRLYNWHAVNDRRGLAPAGWHIPSEGEWSTLINYLGGKSVAGRKMKEAGTAHWPATSDTADNSSGFTALYISNRRYDGSFWLITVTTASAYWWTSTEAEPGNTMPDAKSIYASVFFKSPLASISGEIQNAGLSVRCVKD
jgi:uncharacterized protein (TIGR02145 family)